MFKKRKNQKNWLTSETRKLEAALYSNNNLSLDQIAFLLMKELPDRTFDSIRHKLLRVKMQKDYTAK